MISEKRTRRSRGTAPQERKRPHGFTFIEMLVVLAVATILLVIAIDGLRSFRQSSDLNRAADESMTKLHTARTRTVESEGASAWGVHAESRRIVLFKGTAFIDGAPDNDVTTFPATVTLSVISLAGGGADVVFQRISGGTNQYGTLTLSLVADPAETRTITILASGLAELQ